jgi:osmotically-inducible protein OsmY
VANDIQVRIPDSFDRTDTEIARAVRNALEWDIWIPADRIRSSVSDGWVTLEGDVSYLGEREDAERAVRHLKGVRGVTNKIIVSIPKVEPEEVRQMIEDALERRAEREAKRIHVEVNDRTVSLSGTVRSWAEKRAILGIVSHAPGVRGVNENLFVDPLM